jgi:hypothetical protein
MTPRPAGRRPAEGVNVTWLTLLTLDTADRAA